MAFLLVIGAASAAVLHAARRPWRSLAAAALQLVVLACLLISVAEHAFFVSQGEYLPGQMLGYAFSNAHT